MARMAVIVLILGICLPDVLPARMVLKAGEIDSGKVRVGAFAEVVYGKGKRDPVSGQWEKLARARGYVKAVDAEGLTLGGSFRKKWKKRIAFARIERLIIAESRREMGRLKDTLRRRKGPVSILQLSEGRRIRIRTLGAEEEITAGFHRATRDTLFLQKWRGILGREKRPASIALTDISRLEVYQYRKSYAMPGAIIGAVTVMLVLSSGDDSNEGGIVSAGIGSILYGFAGPVLCLMGGGVGALAGSMFGHDVWQTVDHLSPSTVERRRGLSYRLSFRF